MAALTKSFLPIVLLLATFLVSEYVAQLTEEERISAKVKDDYDDLRILEATGRNVTSPPRIIRQPAIEIAYKDDELVTLPCIASGDPHPQYKWTKDGDPLDYAALDIKQVALQGTLEISNPHEMHEGIYQCYASNTYGTALSVKTRLKQAKLTPFDTVTEPVLHRPIVGSYLKLSCTPPYSYPTGNTYWGESKPGSKIKAFETNKRIQLDYSGNLHFANVQLEDDLVDINTKEGKNYVCIVSNEKLRGLVQGDDQRIEPIDEGNLHFANIEMGDYLSGKTYVCIVDNPVLRSLVQGDDQKIQPRTVGGTQQRIKPKLEWSSESPTVAVKSTEKKMKCIFSGYPDPNITWTMEDGSPLPSKVRVSATGHEITIPNVDFPDGDKNYKCTASNTQADPPHTRPYKVLQLRVESMPLWVKEPESVDTSEEENAVFECQAGGVPKPGIRWSINGVPIESDPNPRRQVLNNGELIKYTNVTKTDAAVLQCNASNTHGYIFMNAYLNVLAEPPTWISQPAASVKVAEGQDTNLTCEVYGAPKPVVTWTKGDVAIDVQDPRFRVNTKGKIVGNLTVLNSLIDDAGIYKCTAENKFGKINGQGQLIVRQKTEIVTVPDSATVHAHESVILNCEATTDPAEIAKLKITWLKNGKVIDFSDTETSKSLSLNMQNNSLIIKDSSVDDSASYTCVADNGLDKDEYSAQVIVKDRPDPPQLLYIVQCRAASAQVTWTAGSENNDAIIEYIVYYNTSFDEEGVYHIGLDNIPKSETSATIRLSPWANYTFHAVARNSIGTSDKSIFTWADCKSNSMIPYRNPADVCTKSRGPTELVITWEPMPKLEHNGEGFHYVVSYELLTPQTDERAPLRIEVTNWQQSELIIENQKTFQKYKISVQAKNNQGNSPGNSLTMIYGYSGQGEPQIFPKGFSIVDGTLNDTSVQFMWEEVNEDDEAINGFFVGYKIVYWRVDDPEDKRSTPIKMNDFDPCPPVTGRRRKRQASGNTITGDVHDLWPFSDVKAGILVVNGGQSGVMSDPLSFRTKEGVPGFPTGAKVAEVGAYHVKLEWLPPLTPNGIIIGYSIGYKKLATLQMETMVECGMVLSKKIKSLDPENEYAFTIYAHTGAGIGNGYMLPATTLAVSPPDKPGVGGMEHGENSVNVTIDPTQDGDTKNPGSEFYIEYKKQGDDEWKRTPLEEDHNWINITDLENGELYDIVIVAVNGEGATKKETKSDPTVFRAGPKEDPVITAEPVTHNIASAGWFIGMMCAIIFLLLILLIICLIRRNRGGKYPVHEKEKLRGRNPDDEEENFGEYNNKQPYMPLETKGDEPPYKTKPAVPPSSLDDDEKPLDGSSESDSMAEYEDTDPTKFNEDGSFIGQYGGKRDSRVQPDQQNALSTFV